MITSSLENDSLNEAERDKRISNIKRHTSETSSNVNEVSFNEETLLDEEMMKVYHIEYFVKVSTS